MTRADGAAPTRLFLLLLLLLLRLEFILDPGPDLGHVILSIGADQHRLGVFSIEIGIGLALLF